MLPFLLKRRDDTYFAFSKAFFADIIFKKRKDDLKCRRYSVLREQYQWFAVKSKGYFPL